MIEVQLELDGEDVAVVLTVLMSAIGATKLPERLVRVSAEVRLETL